MIDTGLLERLCTHLEDECERQETVLEVCRAQGLAARAHDIEYLEAKTEALLILIREAMEAERERLELVGEVVRSLNLSVDQQTLSGLIQAVGEPWQSRLRDFQTRVRSVLAETRAANRENSRIMRRSMHVLNRAMDTLLHNGECRSLTYTARGNQSTPERRRAALLDGRG